MIAQNTPYHVGARALIFMIVRKLKYPFILAIVMVVISFGMSISSTMISAWAHGHAGFLQSTAMTLYALQKYGWVLTIFLSVCFSVVAISEYRGLTFTVGDKALYVRSGILTHREIAIPYRQIQTINIVEHASAQMFGLCSAIVVTSATVGRKDSDESEATFPLIHTSLAKDLRDTLLGASGDSLAQ